MVMQNGRNFNSQSRQKSAGVTVCTAPPALRTLVIKDGEVLPVVLIETRYDGRDSEHHPVYRHPDGCLVTADEPYEVIVCDWPESADAERLAPIIADLIGEDC